MVTGRQGSGDKLWGGGLKERDAVSFTSCIVFLGELVVFRWLERSQCVVYKEAHE
jgi:hypothetical protein